MQSKRKCRECGKKTLHARESSIGNGMGCLLIILTAGIFLPIWILIGIRDAFRPWRCQRCGEGRLT